MNARFNLLDEPWLPVRGLDGRVEAVGLLELFARAGEISGLAETDPPNLIAQYRLLLVIFHRALSQGKGQWRLRDMAGYYRDGLPLQLIHGYLEQWRERFFLFHPEFPFMQVAALATAEETRDKTKPWTQIALSSSTGNAPVVFDHAVDTVPVAIAAPMLLRQLLGFLQFTPGGLVKTLRDSDKAGPLANTAAAMPQGDTLAQTLCLALHPAPVQTEQDRPAWEKGAVAIAALKGEPTLATGPNDRYTRLSRAVLLLPEDDGLAVARIRFAAGVALADDEHAPDPMASYRMGSVGLVRLSFTEGRALWRDLATFLPDASGKHAVAAAVLSWAEALRQSMGETASMPILVAGLASDQAKLLRWRAERFLLPRRLLEQAEASDELRGFLRPTEEDFSHLRQTATTMLARSMPDESHKDTRSRARSLFENGPAGALYFSALERQLPRLLDLIGESRLDEADAHWRDARHAAVVQAWSAACKQSGSTAKALRAQTRAEPAYHSLLKPLKSPSSVEEQAHV
ncbi:type I-E CRISPR-associated protein Cse1/CasA [Chromobacterium subtsugae]|uniref:Type I-E CRISPR-associated protein Cse1/CasA n=1 Tax=Chromobacterium subtsugae TaxID=251747 RepID=A0ABS7F9M4_9NEIS|nr:MULTISPECIES: type I-E CRISPR-associated protein Cse1/CasA [Chromobacterium]KUM02498.1 type I-E CRISPR-associated protein Cse1/CasA [Chromobacterium subtsugae]KZE87883.1 type I-E CRISPR-associated protein Cse1/CasA [Chromobacterium sp. F49]MBW7565375.1 type I-E CRISPR-associated protein Cse1/CasA [Chromobacterium subtsugae]MBW8286774.1 type I-E CRISPR-associated protein Cse1/CasA [Chromobacterium subtsugae]OBU86090.1 CRISPR-associated protein Cse1 [Chromobacterium subtsugae]